MTVYRDAALATFKRAGSYEAAKREIARDRDNNAPGTVSFAFHQAALKELNRLHFTGELGGAKKNPAKIRHDICRHCGQDIEGPTGGWRDRGNNRTCPAPLLGYPGGKPGTKHAPMVRAKNPDDRLTMAHLDMNGNALAKNGGDHVELHPGLDLWMRGARYGTTKKISVDGIATVKMDHPGVKRLQRIPVGRLKLTTQRNPRKRRRSAAQKAATARMIAANKMTMRGNTARDRAKMYSGKRRFNPRRSKAPLSGFQVAALRQGKILFLSGVAMTSNREAASNYGNVATARHVAKQVRDVGHKLGISKVAVVTKHDGPTEIRRFLLGGV